MEINLVPPSKPVPCSPHSVTLLKNRISYVYMYWSRYYSTPILSTSNMCNIGWSCMGTKCITLPKWVQFYKNIFQFRLSNLSTSPTKTGENSIVEHLVAWRCSFTAKAVEPQEEETARRHNDSHEVEDFTPSRNSAPALVRPSANE